MLDMFRSRLAHILNHGHSLYRLSGLGGVLEGGEFGKLYSEEGRPGILVRLMVGLTCLSHAFNTSNEETGGGWKIRTTNISAARSIFGMLFRSIGLPCVAGGRE